MNQDIYTRLSQWCDVIRARYEEIRQKYSHAGMLSPREFDFKIGSVKVVVKDTRQGDTVTVYLQDGRMCTFLTGVIHREIPANLLSEIREGVLSGLDRFEREFDGAVAAKKAWESEYDNSVLKQLDGFENDLTSDALQKGKIYPP